MNLRECQTCFFSSSNFFICPECKYSSCIKCWKRFFNYTMLENSRKIHCMNVKCNKKVEDIYIYQFFDKKYTITYNKLRSEVVYRNKKIKFKDLFPIVEVWKKIYSLNQQMKRTKISILVKNLSIHKLFDFYDSSFVCENKKNIFLILKLILSDNRKATHLPIKLKYILKNIKKKLQLEPNLNKEDKNKILNFISSFDPQKSSEEDHINRKNLFKIMIDILDEEHLDEIIQKSFENNKLIFYDLFVEKYIENVRTLYQEIDKLNKIHATTVSSFCFSEDCNGLVDIDNVCTSCNMLNCKKCSSICDLKVKHTCKEEDIQTTQLLKDSTRCPSCKEVVTKISGCDVMWCIKCHTHFDYMTGDFIKNGNLHNPEYVEYLEKNNIDINLNLIDILPYPTLPDSEWKNETLINLISDVYVFYNSFVIDQIYQSPHNVNLNIFNHMSNRQLEQKMYVDHILGFVNDKKIKTEIGRLHKSKLAWKSYQKIIEEFVLKLKSIYEEHLIEVINQNSFIKNLKETCDETNKNLSIIENRYGNKGPFVHFDLNHREIRFTVLISKAKLKRVN